MASSDKTTDDISFPEEGWNVSREHEDKEEEGIKYVETDSLESTVKEEEEEDDTVLYPDDGESTKVAGDQVNLTRTEAIREEQARYKESARYQWVAAAVTARKKSRDSKIVILAMDASQDSVGVAVNHKEIGKQLRRC
jgi:DNA polymerase III alpha subunit